MKAPVTPVISLNNTQPKREAVKGDGKSTSGQKSSPAGSSGVQGGSATANGQNADGFSLEKFEYYAYARQGEKAAQQFIKLLQSLERGYGNPNISLARGPVNSIADNDVAQHLTSRFAGAVTAMFTDPTFKLSKEGFKSLVFFQRWISHIFGGSHYRNADHIIRAINVDDQTSGKVEVKTEDILKLLLLWVPESEIQLSYDDFWRFDKSLAANAFLAMLTPRFLGSPAAHHRREFLLQYLPEKLNEIDDLDQLNAGNLLDVYWNTSYSNLKTKHHIKRPINRLIRKKIQQWGIKDVVNVPDIHDGNKPRIFIVVGKYFCHNVVYRTLRNILEGCLTDFHIIGIMPNKSTDETSAKGFNEIIELPDKPLIEQLKFMTQKAEERKPFIILYPSVGEIFLTLFGINMRMAPIQIASIGATGSTESPFIDYFLLEDNQVKDEGYFSEKLLRIPRSANPMTLPPSFKEVEPIYNENPEVVDVSVIMTANKINPDFLLTLREISRRAKSRMKFTMSGSLFLPGPVKEHIDHVINFYLGDVAEVLPPIDYLKYIDRLRHSDLFLLSFPFTGLNTIVDYFCVGLLGVASGFGNDLAETFGEAYFRAVDVPEWTIAKTREDYVTAAVRLIDNHSERIALRKKFVAQKPHHRLCEGDNLYLNNILIKMVKEFDPKAVIKPIDVQPLDTRTSKNTIYYVDSAEPMAGGQMVNWRHIHQLRELGINAQLAVINEQQMGQKPPFLPIPQLGFSKMLAKLQGDDIVVIPEIYKPAFVALQGRACRKIIHNQNPYYTFQAWGNIQELDDYGFECGITCGDHPKQTMQGWGSKLDWRVITPYCDEKSFISPDKISPDKISKEIYATITARPKRIGYIARKRPQDHYALVGIFKSLYPQHSDWEWVDFSQFKGDEYIKQLHQCQIWANQGFNDATPMPPLMAMAGGLLACGFHGRGGQAFMNEKNGIWVDDGDYEAFARAVHDTITLAGNGKKSLATLQNGLETAKKYQKTRFDGEFTAVWGDILGDKKANFTLSKQEKPAETNINPPMKIILPPATTAKTKASLKKLPTCRIFAAYHNNPGYIIKNEVIKPILVSNHFPDVEGIELKENSGKNIADKSKWWAGAAIYYWIRHNDCKYDYIGYYEYRRVPNFNSPAINFQFPLEQADNLVVQNGLDELTIRTAIKDCDIMLASLCTIGLSIYDHHAKDAGVEKLPYIDNTRAVMADICPEYLPSFDNLFNGNKIHWWAMLVMKKQIFMDYVDWQHEILCELDKRMDISHNPLFNGYHTRAVGGIAERLLNIYVWHNMENNQWKIKEFGVTHVNVKSYTDDLERKLIIKPN